MKKRTKNLTLAALLVFVVLGGGTLWLQNNNTLFNLFFPPNDLYEPLVFSPLGNENKKYVFNVMHKYPGQHEIVIQTPSSPDIGVSYKMDFLAQVALRSDVKEIISKEVVVPDSQFWGNDDGGIVLLNYRVPEEVPKYNTVQISVSISGNISKFNKRYGNSQLIVRKRSDK